MRLAEAFGDLKQVGRDILTTREAATRWRCDSRTAGRRLASLEEAGLVTRIRRGLWAVEPITNPYIVAPYLTAPYPSYVSLWSGLSHHGLIEQIPRRISLASLDRARTIETSLGVFETHHLLPELFGGFQTSGGIHMAGPEKALFDTVYMRAAAGSRAYFPELTPEEGFDRRELLHWLARIQSRRLRTIVGQRLNEVLHSAGIGQIVLP